MISYKAPFFRTTYVENSMPEGQEVVTPRETEADLLRFLKRNSRYASLGDDALRNAIERMLNNLDEQHATSAGGHAA